MKKLLKQLNQVRDILSDIEYNHVDISFNETIEQIDDLIDNMIICEICGFEHCEEEEYNHIPITQGRN